MDLIDRRNVKKTPKSDVNASEDFLEVVVVVYILAAALACRHLMTCQHSPLFHMC